MARNRRSQRNNKNVVQNVRVVDTLGGMDSVKVDRQLSAIHDSSNHVQMLCSSQFDLSATASTETTGNITWSQVTTFDDYISLAQQFLSFRVRSLRFDIYDVNPAVSTTGVFSTFHDQYTTATQPVFTFANVVDGTDSLIVPPGIGKAQLTWVGHTTNEKGYYDVVAADAAREDFGGLRYVVPPNGTSQAIKYRVIVKAIVDFRGRR